MARHADKDMRNADWAGVRERQLRRASLVDAWWRLAELTPTSRILDVGCGPGVFARAYAERVRAPGLVIASDASLEALALLEADLARSPDARLTTLRHDAQEPWPALPRLDVAIATDMLHHVDDPLAVLRELRAVAPRLLVAEFDPEGAGEIGPPREMRLSLAQMTSLLEKAGWRIVRSEALEHEHYAVAASRRD